VPTQLELAHLRELGGFDEGSCITRIAGFGPVAAAASATEAVCALRPARVILLGIAGTYDPERFSVASALEFEAVAIDGIGAADPPRTAGPRELSFPQWPGSAGTAPIFDRVELASRRAGGESQRLLLSVGSCSDSRAAVVARRERFPDAVAEDMEGFGVALACALRGVPLRVVRGISNVAGDRDRTRWPIRAALSAARELVLEILRDGARGDEPR
jgi:futalosine hydrolase